MGCFANKFLIVENERAPSFSANTDRLENGSALPLWLGVSCEFHVIGGLTKDTVNGVSPTPFAVRYLRFASSRFSPANREHGISATSAASRPCLRSFRINGTIPVTVARPPVRPSRLWLECWRLTLIELEGALAITRIGTCVLALAYWLTAVGRIPAIRTGLL